MMLSLFIIMRRRACPSVALIACFVPMILPAHDYALQARPYALLLGLCGWAFAFWQRGADHRPGRTISLLLLFLCLTFAVWTHYLAVLIFIPLVVGELWRTAVSGFDRAMWFTLLTPVAAVLAYIPFLSAASAYRSVPLHGVMVYEMFDTYSFVLSSRLFAVLLLCCLAALALPAIYGRLLASSDEEVTFRAHEYVSIATLFLFPFFVFGSAKLLTHSYVPRYALPFTVAAALLIAASFGILARPVKGLGPLAMVLILLQAALPLRTFVHGLPPPADLIDGSSTEPFDHFPDLPIAMPRTDDYLRFRIFGPNRIRRRMFLVSFSPDEVRRVVNPVVAQELPTVDLMNAALHRTIAAPVQDFQDFIDAHPRFLLMNTIGREEVLNKSRQLCWIGQSKGQDVYLVQRPGQ
jgi:hypothetical protein